MGREKRKNARKRHRGRREKREQRNDEQIKGDAENNDWVGKRGKMEDGRGDVGEKLKESKEMTRR